MCTEERRLKRQLELHELYGEPRGWVRGGCCQFQERGLLSLHTPRWVLWCSVIIGEGGEELIAFAMTVYNSDWDQGTKYVVGTTYTQAELAVIQNP